MTAFAGVVVVEPGFDAHTPVAGLPPLLRHVLALQDAGADEVVVLGHEIGPDARIRVPIRDAVSPGLAVLVVPADVTFHRNLAGRIAQTAAVEVTRHGSDAAALWWAPAQRARELIDAVAQGARVAAESAPLHADEFVLRAASASERARSRARHLRSLIKPTGGVIDRKLMRRLSLPITAVLLRTRVTPTQVTLLSLAVAVVAAALVAVPTPATTLAGALLHWWVRILDCVDGELARIRYQSTRVGEWLDGVGDVIGISALVLAVTWRAGGDDPLWLALGAAGIGLYLVGQVLQALATWEATGGGAVQRVRWSFQAPQAATGLDRLVAALHGMARIDFISTAYALLVVAGQFRLLVALHLAAASLAAVYFGADRLRRRASTPVSRR